MLLLVIPASVVQSFFEFGFPVFYSRSENPTSVASPRALPTVIQKYIIYTDGQKYNIEIRFISSASLMKEPWINVQTKLYGWKYKYVGYNQIINTYLNIATGCTGPLVKKMTQAIANNF